MLCIVCMQNYQTRTNTQLIFVVESSDGDEHEHEHGPTADGEGGAVDTSVYAA